MLLAATPVVQLFPGEQHPNQRLHPDRGAPTPLEPPLEDQRPAVGLEHRRRRPHRGVALRPEHGPHRRLQPDQLDVDHPASGGLQLLQRDPPKEDFRLADLKERSVEPKRAHHLLRLPLRVLDLLQRLCELLCARRRQRLVAQAHQVAGDQVGVRQPVRVGRLAMGRRVIKGHRHILKDIDDHSCD